MKKLLFIFVSAIFLATVSCSALNTGTSAEFDVEEASRSTVYFLYSPTCSRSNAARTYISENYNGLDIKYVDTGLAENVSVVKGAMECYHLTSSFSTPLICMGSVYIEGWGSDKKSLFDDYIQAYLL